MYPLPILFWGMWAHFAVYNFKFCFSPDITHLRIYKDFLGTISRLLTICLCSCQYSTLEIFLEEPILKELLFYTDKIHQTGMRKVTITVMIEAFIGFWITCFLHGAMSYGTKYTVFLFLIVKNWTIADRVGFNPRSDRVKTRIKRRESLSYYSIFLKFKDKHTLL